MNRLTETEILSRVVEIVRKNITADTSYKEFLFGSRASGKANDRSDYDIGIKSEDDLQGSALVNSQWDLEDLPVLQKIELVDFNSVSEDFERVASENMRVLYEQ